jgi:hypothetical protein
MNRRRFIFLIGAAAPGLWFEGTGLILLPKRMVIDISGRCSFCGKAGKEVFGLAGVLGRTARVCNKCIDICFDIIGEAPPPPPPPDEYLVSDESSAAFEFEPIGLARNTMSPLTTAEVEDLIEQERKPLDKLDPRPWRRNDVPSCSFCDRTHHEALKLIAGPSVCICDICVGDAAALISMHC